MVRCKKLCFVPMRCHSCLTRTVKELLEPLDSWTNGQWGAENIIKTLDYALDYWGEP